MVRLLPAALPGRATLAYAPSPRPAIVDGDAGQLGQLVMNLILNAGEAPAGRRGEIRVSTAVRTWRRCCDSPGHAFPRGHSSCHPRLTDPRRCLGLR